MMGGLHTWQRDMGYHPHVHFIVPGGGLLPDHSQWLAFAEPTFLSLLKHYHLSSVPSSEMGLKKPIFSTPCLPASGKKTG
jgi:hypothetical protein